MESCCGVSAEPPVACPACGQVGRGVDRITPQSMLRPAALARLTESAYRFCPTPSCPVVYFEVTGFELPGRFAIDEIGVPVFQKQPRGERTVCYCCAITESDIRRELASSGRSTAVEYVSALVKAGRCACEIRNPQGSCCLGNLVAAVRSAEIEIDQARSKPDSMPGSAASPGNGGPGGTRQLSAAGAAVAGAGAACVATAAAACCTGPVLAPLVVAVLGASGAAWAAGLKPYTQWMLGGSLLLLVYGFRSAYRAPKGCDVRGRDGRRWSGRAVRIVLWAAAVLWLVALAANLFLGA